MAYSMACCVWQIGFFQAMIVTIADIFNVMHFLLHTFTRAFACLGLLLLPVNGSASGLPRIVAKEHYFATEEGDPVYLKGVNLGNWFLLEAWMFGMFDIPDQHTILQILDRRFGRETRNRIIQKHRETWVTQADFEAIRSFGMNVVRLPVHYSMLIDIKQTDLIKESGFAWIDRVLEMAEANGLYVILDLHGVPGGQSVEQPTGRLNSNGLWGSELNQDLTVHIWRTLAERYKDNSNIAAYDIINEPYADNTRALIREELRSLCERIYKVIRDTGDEHVILFPGTYKGFFFYQQPQAMRAKNLGFTEHFYPGIFSGGTPSIDTHARYISQEIYPRADLLKRWSAPFLVGEFNVTLETAGGDRMMQHYWKLYESLGWAATMWSYKLIKPIGGVQDNNWYMVTNKDSIEIPDLHTGSLEDIIDFFDHSDEQFLADPDAVSALKGELTPVLHLEQYPKPRDMAPKAQLLEGWSITDVGGATPKGSAVFTGNASIELYGGGDDIFGTHDGFNYVYQRVEGEFNFHARFTGIDAVKEYAKSGLMVRSSIENESAMVLLNIFSDGSIAFAVRSRSASDAQESKVKSEGFPIDLRLRSENNRVIGEWKDAAGQWLEIGRAEIDSKYIGFATVSNHLNQIAKANVSDYILTFSNE